MVIPDVEVNVLEFTDVCPVCGVAHQVAMPHVVTGKYEEAFRRAHGRAPTAADAATHCTPEVRRAWEEALHALAYELCFRETLRVSRGRRKRDNQGNMMTSIIDLIVADMEGRWP